MIPDLLSELFTAPEHQTYTLPGGRPAALLLHGFPGTAAETRSLGQALHAAGWTVQGLLLPGFGPEFDRLGEQRYGDWVRAAVEALRALQAHHHPTLLVGFSMGAAVAAVAAANAQPDGLALLAPFSGAVGPMGAVMPVLRRLVRTVKPFRLFKPNFSNPDVRRGLASFLPNVDLDDPTVQSSLLDVSLPLSVLDEVRLVGEAAQLAAGSVRAPALIVQGANDRVVMPKTSRRLVYAFDPPARYLEVDGAHDLLDENGPAWLDVTKAVLAFAERLSQGQGLEIPG